MDTTERSIEEAIMLPEEEPRERPKVVLAAYTIRHRIKQFIPMPRDVLQIGLNPSATLLYGLLLDRATLSQRTGWCDEDGWVYIHYTIRSLSKEMWMSESSIRRMLLQLEEHKLIRRVHYNPGSPSFIFLRVPVVSVEWKRPCADDDDDYEDD